MRHWLKNQRGFTLAELLIVTAVTGLVMGGVFVVQQGGQQAYLLGSNRVETQQNARVALDLMTRELRSAQSITTIVSSLTSPPAPDITFVDQDQLCGQGYPGCVPGVGNTMRYCWSSTSTGCVTSGRRAFLIRTVNGTITPLIGGVQSVTLTYYAKDPPALGGRCKSDPAAAPYPGTDPTQVCAVKISLVTTTEESVGAGMPGDQRATMESTVKLRLTLF